MGMAVSAYWPGMSAEQLDAQPGFYNGPGSWAHWVAGINSRLEEAQTLVQLGVGELLTFTTEGVDDAQVEWVKPAHLERAALRLRNLVLARDPRIGSILSSYARVALASGPPSEQFAQDLSDVAALADYAARETASLMTLRIG
jgi:hypothetical protein